MNKINTESKTQKIVLYNPNPLSKHQLSRLAPLALLAVARILDKENYEINIISPCLYEYPHTEVLKRCKGAICLGISCITGYQIIDGLNVAKLVRQKYPELPIVWGGWHPSMEPEQTLKSRCADIVVRGQGGRTFTELIHYLEEGKPLRKILGISYKEKGKIFHNPDRPLEDINNFPPLPYHLIDIEKVIYNTEYGSRTINYVSSIGCPFRCNFCEEQVVHKRKWSGLDAKRVVDEIERLVKHYNIESIAFHDSNFFVNRERVRQFCEELIKRKLKIKWGNVNGRTKQLLSYDDELWKLMKKSGLGLILTGAESGFQKMLDFINKDTKVEDTIHFAEKCKKHGVKSIFSFFIGVPWGPDNDKTEELIEKEFKYTLEIIDKIISIDRRHRIILSNYTPYPGSPLYYRSLECGFKPPKSFEGWGNFRLEWKTTPWIPPKLGKLVEPLTTYIFFFIDPDSYNWVTARIKNVALRLVFKLFFRFFEVIARVRWKYKFFKFLIDYRAYRFIKDHGAIFGFYRS